MTWQCSQLVVRWYLYTVTTVVTTYDLHDTKKHDVQEEWNVTKSGHQYHT